MKTGADIFQGLAYREFGAARSDSDEKLFVEVFMFQKNRARAAFALNDINRFPVDFLETSVYERRYFSPHGGLNQIPEMQSEFILVIEFIRLDSLDRSVVANSD